METFLDKHADSLKGVLSGFDRIVFRGLFRRLSYVDGFSGFLGGHGVLFKNFKPFVNRVSDQLVEHAKAMANSQRREYRYLHSSRFSKEDIARHIMERDEVKEGLICVLSCVEPCRSYSIRKNAKAKTLDLVSQERKCLHLYFYYLDPEFGFMHVRLQTWFPMSLQVCLNGREYWPSSWTAAE